MSTQWDRQDQIDRYILDELSEEERIVFEKEIEKDESLRQEVELMEHIANAFQRKCEKDALEELKDLSSIEALEEMLSSSPKRIAAKNKSLIISILSAAAAILIFLYIGFTPKYSSEQLFAEYYLPEQFEILPGRGDRSPEEKQNELLFTETIELLENNKLSQATDHLIYLSSLSGFKYKEEAEWALALIYLKKDQRKEAQKVLLQMIETNSYYAEEAKKVVEKLKKRKWF